MGFGIATINKKRLAEVLGVDAGTLEAALNQSRVGGMMRVWKGELREVNGFRFFNGQVSTSYRKDEHSPWEQDFSGFATFTGKALDKILGMNVQDGNAANIVVTSATVKTKYSKEKNATYTNYIVYDFEPYASNGAPAKPVSKAKPAKNSGSAQAAASEEVDDPSDDLPF